MHVVDEAMDSCHVRCQRGITCTTVCAGPHLCVVQRDRGVASLNSPLARAGLRDGRVSGIHDRLLVGAEHQQRVRPFTPTCASPPMPAVYMHARSQQRTQWRATLSVGRRLLGAGQVAMHLALQYASRVLLHTRVPPAARLRTGCDDSAMLKASRLRTRRPGVAEGSAASGGGSRPTGSKKSA